jgi:NADPH-dependent 2,4-dienoyl-CoA reductase/sulfur reductase-like enzyme
MSVVIVGGSVAGISTARALRDHGYGGAVTVLEAEHRPPYDKPPLSKEMLRAPCPQPVPLLTPNELVTLDIDLRLGVTATGLEPARKVVRTTSGEVGYSTLVVATGSRPRTLSGAEVLTGVYTLRCADDAVALHAELPTARHLVIIGGGFIGSEIASAATQHTCRITIIEAQRAPLCHVLGAEVGTQIADLHRSQEVEVFSGHQVHRFIGDTRIEGVVMADGTELRADLVVVGVGALPATDWLRDSGLPLANGIICDENLRVEGYLDLYAVGDAACRHHPLYAEPLRIEHWTNAGEHGRIAAATITGGTPPTPQLPYVWTDLYGRRLQIVGRPALGRVAAQFGSMADGAYVAIYADESGVAVGAFVADHPRSLMACRRAIMAHSLANQIDVSLQAVADTAPFDR